MALSSSSTAACRASRWGYLLTAARTGDPDPLGELLESYRNYLALLANSQLDRKLRARISASDLVQETMLGAYRDFRQFRGASERQLLAWLRQILVHRLHAYVQQHVAAEKRDIRREVSIAGLQQAMNRSTMQFEHVCLADKGPSPSAAFARGEQVVLLADLLAKMPSDYRDVIVCRTFRGLSFQATATELGRSCGAVRMLWLRAIKQLRDEFRVFDPTRSGAEA